MRKYIFLGTFFVLFSPNLVFASVQISPNNTAVCANYFRVMANKATAAANGADSIDLTFVFTNNPHPNGCMGGGPSIVSLRIEASGTGNSLTKSTVAATNGEGTTFEATSLKSTVAGSKNITIYADWGVGAGFDLEHPYAGGSVTFTTATSTAATTTNPAARSTAQTQAAPATPVLEKLTAGETEITGEEVKQAVQFLTPQKKVFSGKTIPNGIVKLYFHSDPFEATTMADGQGNWTYELTRDLGTGDHTLQIAVTDPTTNLTSEKSAPVSFAIKDVQPICCGPEPIPEKNYSKIIVAGGLLSAIVIGGIVFLIMKRKKKQTKEIKENE